MSKGKRTPTRWYFDPKGKDKRQRWERKIDGKWIEDKDRTFPDMDSKSLIQKWISVASSDDPAVSTLAKHFGKTIKVVKTNRAKINTAYRLAYKTDQDPLVEIPDFTQSERRRIDAANKQDTIEDIFNGLSDDLKDKMKTLMSKANDK